MATATIQVAYEAETTSLKATVNEINQINDKVVQGAQDSAAKVKKEYTGIANSFAAAFSGGQAKKALDNQAKAIDNVGKSGKSLTGQLRGLKQELAALEIAGQDGTAAFNQLLIAAAKLEDQIGDTRARVKILASDTFKFDAAVGATQALASGFELAQGAAALFGSENEDLQKALVKITAATAVANSVNELSNLIKGESALKTAVLTARTFALTAAQAAYTTVVGTSTGAMKVFRIALAATGVGLLVIGLGLLIENFDKVKQFAFKAIPGLEGFAKGVGVVIDETKKLLGFEDPKKTENIFEKLVTLENRKVKAKEAAINRRIDLLKAENKDTTALEIEREQLLLNFANKKKSIIEANAANIKAAGLDASETLFDLEQEILDRENAIQVTRVENRKLAIEKSTVLERKGFEGLKKVKEEELQLNLEVSTAYQDQLNADNALRVASLETEKAVNGESLENTIATIKAKAKAEADALGLTELDSEKRQKIYADAESAITKATQDETDKRIATAQDYAEKVTSIFKEINSLSAQLTENRIAEIQTQSDKELEAINNSNALERDKANQRIALQKRTAALVAAEKTKQAKQDKALAIFQIAVDTAIAISKANALGPPQSIPAIIAAAALGAIQLAAVIAKPIPKFEKGGVVGGRLHSGGGTMVEAERDEFIVNRRQSMRHRSELDAINSSSDAFRRLIEQRYVRPALMDYVAGNRSKQGVTVNASLNSKSMEKEIRGMRKDLSKRNVTININQQDSRYLWQ